LLSLLRVCRLHAILRPCRDEAGKTQPSAHHPVATCRLHEESAQSVPRYPEIHDVVHSTKTWRWMSWFQGAGVVGALEGRNL